MKKKHWILEFLNEPKIKEPQKEYFEECTKIDIEKLKGVIDPRIKRLGCLDLDKNN